MVEDLEIAGLLAGMTIRLETVDSMLDVELIGMDSDAMVIESFSDSNLP